MHLLHPHHLMLLGRGLIVLCIHHLVQLRDILTVLLVFFMGRVRADPHPWFIA
jgi:hypothetical protein